MTAVRAIGDPVLRLDGVSLSFGGVKALNDISLDVREHEIRAIIGPNGAGKSSLLNVINGVYHPQQGTITFRGKPRHDMDTHETAALGIARTFQNIALFRGMSVLDNIMTGRNLKMRATVIEQAIWVGRARREELENRAKVEEVIDFLEIQHIRKTPVGRLPYGLQKRVELARALAAEPSLLLLDEPMAGMNVEGLRVPVVHFSRQEVAAFQQQDALAGIGEGVRERPAACPGSDDDYVRVLGHRPTITAVAGHWHPLNRAKTAWRRLPARRQYPHRSDAPGQQRGPRWRSRTKAGSYLIGRQPNER